MSKYIAFMLLMASPAVAGLPYEVYRDGTIAMCKASGRDKPQEVWVCPVGWQKRDDCNTLLRSVTTEVSMADCVQSRLTPEERERWLKDPVNPTVKKPTTPAKPR